MLELVTKWFRKGRMESRTPRTFDYTYAKRGWGHDISFRPSGDGTTMRASGWGPSPEGGDELKREWMESGDFIILSHPGGQKTARYRIDEIRYEFDPRDQWFAALSFAPRRASEDGSQGT